MAHGWTHAKIRFMQVVVQIIHSQLGGSFRGSVGRIFSSDCGQGYMPKTYRSSSSGGGRSVLRSRESREVRAGVIQLGIRLRIRVPHYTGRLRSDRGPNPYVFINAGNLEPSDNRTYLSRFLGSSLGVDCSPGRKHYVSEKVSHCRGQAGCAQVSSTLCMNMPSVAASGADGVKGEEEEEQPEPNVLAPYTQRSAQIIQLPFLRHHARCHCCVHLYVHEGLSERLVRHFANTTCPWRMGLCESYLSLRNHFVKTSIHVEW